MSFLSIMCKSLLVDPKPHPSNGKISPTPTLVLQMRALDSISFHDPIVIERKLPNKELLLGNLHICHKLLL